MVIVSIRSESGPVNLHKLDLFALLDAVELWMWMVAVIVRLRDPLQTDIIAWIERNIEPTECLPSKV